MRLPKAIMTNFNPKSNKFTAEQWQIIASETISESNAQYLVIGGIVGGFIAASATAFPPTGLLVASWALYEAWRKTRAQNRNDEAIAKYGCVAHVLTGDNLRDYREQVGDEEVLKQMSWASDNGYVLSNDALDFLETQPPFIRQLPQSRDEPSTTTTTVETQVIDYYDPTASATVDIVGEMTERISNMLIIGIPGSGKGMLVANTTRVAKTKHQNLKIFGIDPKNDPKETGYFDCCDVVKRFACMDAKPGTVAAWAEAVFDEYAVYAQKHQRTLLIVDEGTMLGNKLQQAKSTLLIDKLTSYASGGDSAGRNVWFMMQSPYVSGASLNLSTTSQMTSVVIAFEENIGAIAQWKSAKIFKNLSLDEVSELVNNSSTGRAIYYGKTGQWYMMPQLRNYSGYDRDKRQYLPGFTSQGNEPITKDIEAINRLEESLNSNLQNEHSKPNPGLSPSAELLLSYFDNVKQKSPKSIADLKDANKLRQLDSSELLKALRELIVAEHLTFDTEGRYLKPDWE